MRRIPAFLLCTTIIACCATAHAQVQPAASQQDAVAAPAPKIKYYNYANDESEYSVMLPEAPTVQTIWEKSPETKTYLLGNLPDNTSFLGEIGTFSRTDIDTEQTFEAQVIFLKAPQSFLQSLTEDKIKGILEQSYAGSTLINQKFRYSVGSGPNALKWATLSGFLMDAHNQPTFVATHYLTGTQSIFVVKVQFSATNQLYNDYYNKLVGSITYSPP